MEHKEDEISLDSSVPETFTEMSIPIENHNLKLRRRNVIETINLVSNEEETSDSKNNIPLVRMSDSTKAWYDDIIPRIPDIANFSSSGKQNGVLNHEDDNSSLEYNFDDTDILTNTERIKISVIRGSIVNPNLTLGELKLLGCSSEGLVHDEIRRILWPKLLRLSEENNFSITGLETIHNHIPNEVYQQILKDVARSGSHISQNATQHEIDDFHEQLTQIMCWVLHKHSMLNYYQGYNDIAATVLLVMGLEKGLHVLESISLEFLERFMEKTMEKVNQELFYIFALLERVHPTLLEHLENVELFPHFALAEYTTWYAHKYAENRKLLHRLFDYFLGSPPLMPLYLSTVIVAHRATEIFNTTPDMGHTHKVLCTLPDDLPFEKLLVEAKNLYRQYPPESINNDVREYDQKRKSKEQEWKAKAEASRQEREKQRQLRIVQLVPRIPYRIRSYKTITVVTILALGLYAFLRSSSGLN
ncbi:TBC1 domain family member 20 isoform X1 [Apis cerana]|uniref:TBC1 domain family member n=1 Tax=Apis cerana cerana TaxID=94128 RepID=A0A2A3ENW6_APICC|nr:TBC1 domain family member 20 isoform X1 [Apis cerana]PBC33455.1 TBC1 domain family member [Apis cerana cerana]